LFTSQEFNQRRRNSGRAGKAVKTLRAMQILKNSYYVCFFSVQKRC